MKKVLFVIFGLAGILVAIAASLVIWYVLQQEYMHPTEAPAVTGSGQTPAIPVSAPTTGSSSAKSYFIPADRFTDAEKTAAKAFGIDLSNGFTVTAAMYSCAEAKLGTARMQAIIGGSAPSLSEDMALYSCK